MRLIGVIRQSRHGEDAVSPDQQRARILDHARTHGHEIIDWATDLGVSGAVSPFERRDLGPWLTDERASEYDGLIAFKIDRFSRRLIDFARLLDWAATHGKSLAAVADPLDTSTHMGRVIAQIIAMLAEWELENIRSRIVESRRYLRTTTRFAGGKIPYGYWPVENPSGEGKILEIDEETSEIIRAMVEKIMAGASMASVRQDLATRGVLAPIDYIRQRKGLPVKGIEWSTRGVQVILRSRTLLGEFEHNGRVVRGKDGLPLRRAEPLLDAEEFALLQSKLDEATRPRVYKNPRSLLADVLHCGSCDGKMYEQISRKGKRVYAYYRCLARGNGKPCAQPASVRSEVLDEIITEAFLGAIGDAERQERVWVPGEDHAEELARVEKAIEEVREEWDADLYEGDRPGYMVRLRSLTSRQKTLRALPNRPGAWEFVGLGESYRDAWARMDEGERRGLLLASGITATLGTQDFKGDPTLLLHLVVPDELLGRVRSGGSSRSKKSGRTDVVNVRDGRVIVRIEASH